MNKNCMETLPNGERRGTINNGNNRDMTVQMSIILGWEGLMIGRIIGSFPFHFPRKTRKKYKKIEKTRKMGF